MVIIGAGPAGLTAGIFTARAGLKTLCLERLCVGGQAVLSYEIANFPAFNSISGFDLTKKMEEQARLNGADILDYKVQSLERKKGGFLIKTAEGEYFSKKVIIACGNKPRKLGLKNEDVLTGHGISYCASCDGGFFKNKPVAVVGGGDTAMEYVEYLSKIAKNVYLINRTDKFRANEKRLNDVKRLKNVKIITNAVVKELKGDEKLEEITIEVAGEKKNLKLDGLFVAIGHIPDLEFVKMDIEIDKFGFIKVNEDMQTSVKNCFAAGDIVSKKFKQIITACADGATAGNACIGGK